MILPFTVKSKLLMTLNPELNFFKGMKLFKTSYVRTRLSYPATARTSSLGLKLMQLIELFCLSFLFLKAFKSVQLSWRMKNAPLLKPTAKYFPFLLAAMASPLSDSYYSAMNFLSLKFHCIRVPDASNVNISALV
jgi:hypothetical protein